jgi:NAD(P)-dependent dehydrogenase (short-subunit alcohol dehydrogenase family)
MRDRVAVVTGAAGGIGLGIAEAFAAVGMRLVLADIDGDRLAVQAARLQAAGSQVEAVVTDVGDPGEVQSLAERTMARFGAVHIICNNAGILRGGRTWELTLDDWDAVLRVDLMGVLYGIRSFVPLLLASGDEGHVVIVASMAAVVPVAGIAPYNVAKHGVLALGEVLQAELLATGAPVGVSVIMPGRVATHLGRARDIGAGRSSSSPIEPEFIDAAEVGRQVVEAVRQDRLFAFTHPDRMDEVRARFNRIIDPRSNDRSGSQ